MHTQPLFTTFTALLLLFLTKTSTSQDLASLPKGEGISGLGPGVVVTWEATSHAADRNCSNSTTFQEFQTYLDPCKEVSHFAGSGSDRPYAIESFNITSLVGQYNFTFFAGNNCVSGPEEISLILGDGEQKCVDVSGVNPNSFSAVRLDNTTDT